MLKRITKSIRHQLLKINWIRREVEAHKQEKENRRYHDDWAQKLRDNSNAISDDDSPDNTVLVDYNDGRMMGQRGVVPMYVRVRPFGMGRK